MKRVVPVLVIAVVLVFAWLVGRSSPEPDGGSAPSLPVPTVSSPSTPADEPEIDMARTAVESPPAEPVPAPAVVAAKPPSDPTEVELAAFANSCPPGTIEGIVLRGKEPVAGGQAWLGAESTGGLPWGTPQVWDATVSVRRTEIGADGVFRFEDLRAGTYAVGVRAPDGTSRHVWATLGENSPTQRIRIVLGSSGVRGSVYDEHGSAASGWQVAVYNWGPLLAGEQVIGGTETDSQGSFEYGGLPGGQYILNATPVAGRRDPQARTIFFELKPAEWKTIDVGLPPGGSTWTGRVLMPRGEPLRIAALTELRIESDKGSENIALSQDGGFRVRRAAGTYRLSLFAYSTSGGEGVELGTITLPDRDLNQDVKLPRALVRIRATYRGTRQDPKEAVGSLWTKLKGNNRDFDGVRGADGAEYFLALAPGEYSLWCRPPILGAPGGRIPVHIRPGDDEVDVDVVVGDP